jgi:preprotein translocase subunit SecE
MSKKDQSHAAELERERVQATKQAKQKLKQAEKAKAGKAEKEPRQKKKSGKKVGRFLKDFRGEIKKIIWPDFKTVMKNTGIVLVTVLIIGILVWILDFGLTSGIKGLKHVAQLTKAVEVTEAGATTTAGAPISLAEQPEFVTVLDETGTITAPPAQ